MKLNKRGAASILVVLIIVVLATFGGVALTAGWTNKQLSIKAAQSKADYYALDSAAEEILAGADSVLFASEQSTIEYLEKICELNDLEVVESEEKLAPLFQKDAEDIKSSALRVKKIKEVFTRIYFYYCAVKLNTFAEENGLALIYSEDYDSPQDFLSLEKGVPEAGDLMVEFSLSQGSDPGEKNLDIKIGVNAPEIEINVLSEEAWRTDFMMQESRNALRFEIYSWKLRQNPIGGQEEKPKFG